MLFCLQKQNFTKVFLNLRFQHHLFLFQYQYSHNHFFGFFCNNADADPLLIHSNAHILLCDAPKALVMETRYHTHYIWIHMETETSKKFYIRKNYCITFCYLRKFCKQFKSRLSAFIVHKHKLWNVNCINNSSGAKQKG